MLLQRKTSIFALLFTVLAASTWHIRTLLALTKPHQSKFSITYRPDTETQLLHELINKTLVPQELPIENPQPSLPKVCVLIPVTSAKQAHWSTFEHTFLYQYSLKSISTTTSKEDNVTYRVLIGYDSGDPLFDNLTTNSALHQWASQHLSFASLTTYSVLNPKHKPGPVMNYLSRQAHSSGCDFLYRINDDTQMLTQWSSAFIDALAAFSPPNVGVVGPTCHEGNTAILTHDFVHRSHLDIFGSHYPPELTDWWLDDWISLVYGDSRTKKLKNVVVLHHIFATRYEVTWNSMRLLKTLVEEGNQTLTNFLVGNRHLTPYSNPHIAA